MDKLNEFLTKIRLIVERDKTTQYEKNKRGENFNMFKILGLSRNETKLHSAFLAELLNTKGSHGLKDKFLIEFKKNIIPKSKINPKETEVFVEYNIGQKNEDATQGGIIDILLKDNSGNAIIIENKIDASEQVNQLIRYNNFAKSSQFKDYYLLYLTPEGVAPKTIRTNNRHCITISYRENILPWLNKCLGIAACYPLIRETIRQYIINLKSEILHIMETENEDELIRLASSKEFVESYFAIIENSFSIEENIRQNFINQLANLAVLKGFEFIFDKEICSLEEAQWISFYKPSISNTWGFCIGWNKYKGNEDLCGTSYGISWITQKAPTRISKEKLNSLPNVFGNKQDKDFPFGWDYLHSDEYKNKKWYRWDNIETLKDMTNGKIIKVISDLLDIVVKEKLIEKIKKITNI